MTILVPDNVAKQTSQVVSTLPQFVIEDHPKFVEFMKAYYRWSASEGPAAAMNYMKLNNDVDFVADSLLSGYTNLFAYTIPKEMKADYRFFLKFLKEFYEIKGSEESYKILYRALFNEDVLVYFPRRNLLMTSAAEWATDTSFRLEYSGDGYSLRGMKLKGGEKGYTCIVSDVVKINGAWVIYFQDASGKFIPNETVEIIGRGEYATVIPTYNVKSVVSKPRWYDKDIIRVDDDLVVCVDKIHYGYITGITIVDGGSGFNVGDVIVTKSDYSGTGFKAIVTSVGAGGSVTSVSIKRSGFGYVNANVSFVAANGSGTGFVATPTWNPEFRTIQSASVILNKRKTTAGDVTHTFGDSETITFTDGVYTVPKYWKVIRGAPSTETARITDSNFYQEYSYVLSSIASVGENETAIKKALQIAGLKLFIEQTVSKTEVVKFDSQLLIS